MLTSVRRLFTPVPCALVHMAQTAYSLSKAHLHPIGMSCFVHIMSSASGCRFAANFAGTPWVKVPKVFWEYSSPEVLVLEYCPGG